MGRKSFILRVGMPVLPVFVAALLSFAVYFFLRFPDRTTFTLVVATLSGFFYFVSISFGALYVYTVSQLRGASLAESVLASFVTPFAWITKEVLILTESHPVLECLYWYLSPLSIWLFVLMCAELGVAALIVRKIRIQRNEKAYSMRVPALIIAGSLTVFALMYAWGRGENIYVIFLEGYRFFFGSGL
ncbi:MAG: hypothetical protein M0P04_00065 [Syntrophales bacterium]|nr:hypothetical protein [Syntrophales bacterium]MDD4338886.1 hypothetical protein [Syntrophales bacterium]HOG08358.1 hypothetical protein [Syntrophales bacterium]HPB69608.1 hypothetical protein [Syntrophales bacterium]HQN25424.1 hypothetical protein [Syntrophales bacterium]